MNTRGKLTPGKPTPIRTVPESIERPEYAWKDDVQENIGEPFIQTEETIEKMREIRGCRIRRTLCPREFRNTQI